MKLQVAWLWKALWTTLQHAIRYFQRRQRLSLSASVEWYNCRVHCDSPLGDIRVIRLTYTYQHSDIMSKFVERFKQIVAEEVRLHIQADADEIARKALESVFTDEFLRKIAVLACKEYSHATKRDIQQKVEASIHHQMTTIMKEIEDGQDTPRSDQMGV